jgi:hypothetical protein
MQSRSKAKNKQTNKQTNNLPFCMPVGECRCLFRKKHQGNSCKREGKEKQQCTFRSNTQEIRATVASAAALGGKMLLVRYVTPVDFPGLLAQNTKAEIPTEEEKREVFATRQLGHA